MPDVVITDLNNLPTGVTLEMNDTLTRVGNDITWENVWASWHLEYYNPDVPFHVGEKVQISFQVENWTQGYVRVYGRGYNAVHNDVTGFWKWSIISGMAPDHYLEDANAAVRTNQTTTVILEMTCYQEIYGWVFHVGSIGNDWGGARGTGKTKFLYATTIFNFPDPYGPTGPSAPGGGNGTHDYSSSDDIDYPGDPGVSAVNTGFISLWAPTEQQMLNLSRYMWNVDITTIDFWKRLWADPMDIIYGLNIIPVDFRATGRTIIGGTEHVIVGLVNTKVDMDYLVSQWIDVDCGTIDIDEAWGAYLDYDPYTKLEIYLPYCGYHPLRIDDFMSGSISLKYKIDLLSGACVAMVKATKSNDDENDLDSIVYQFMGNCATQIPVTASQFADAVRSTMSLAASIGTMVATGVGGAAAAASKQGLSTVGKAKLASSMIGEGAATVENVMGIKPAIERSGALGGSAGLLAVQTPYLILTRPRQAHPDEQNKYTGFPSFMTRILGNCSGWTIVKEIHLDNIPCTSEEMIEIDNLLKEGVIL